MNTDTEWSLEDVKRFADEYYNQKLMRKIYCKRKQKNERQQQMLEIVRKLGLRLNKKNKDDILEYFQTLAVNVMRNLIRTGSWRAYWGAPEWIQRLDPSMNIIRKALKAELSKTSPESSRIRHAVLDELILELVRSAHAAASAAATPEDAAQALTSEEAVQRLADSTLLPATTLFSLWMRLYEQASFRLRRLWQADERFDYTPKTMRFTAAHWRVAELALLYDTRLTFATKECLKSNWKMSSLQLLFGLISEAYDKREKRRRNKEIRALKSTAEVMTPMQYKTNERGLMSESNGPQNSLAATFKVGADPTTYQFTIDSTPATPEREVFKKPLSDAIKIDTLPGSYSMTIDTTQYTNPNDNTVPAMNNIMPKITISTEGSYNLTIDSRQPTTQNYVKPNFNVMIHTSPYGIQIRQRANQAEQQTKENAEDNVKAFNETDSIQNPFSEFEFQLKTESSGLVGTADLVKLPDVETRQEEMEIWTDVVRGYMNSGRLASAVSLQRRWQELRQMTRTLLLQRWRHPDSEPIPPLILAVALRFPEVVTEPLPSWFELVRCNEVYELPVALGVTVDESRPEDAGERNGDVGVYYVNKVLNTIRKKNLGNQSASVGARGQTADVDKELLDVLHKISPRDATLTMHILSDEEVENETQTPKDTSVISVNDNIDEESFNRTGSEENNTSDENLLIERCWRAESQLPADSCQTFDEKLLQDVEVIVTPIDKIPIWTTLSRNGYIKCRRFSVRKFMSVPQVDRRTATLRKYKTKTRLNIAKNIRRRQLTKKLRLCATGLSNSFWANELNVRLLELCKPAELKLQRIVTPLEDQQQEEGGGEACCDLRDEPVAGSEYRESVEEAAELLLGTDCNTPVNSKVVNYTWCEPETSDDEDVKTFVIDENYDAAGQGAGGVGAQAEELQTGGKDREARGTDETPSVEELKTLIGSLVCKTRTVGEDSQYQSDLRLGRDKHQWQFQEKRELVQDMLQLIHCVPLGLVKKRKKHETTLTASTSASKINDDDWTRNRTWITDKLDNKGERESEEATGASTKKKRKTKKNDQNNKDCENEPALLNEFDEWERQKAIALKYFTLSVRRDQRDENKKSGESAAGKDAAGNRRLVKGATKAPSILEHKKKRINSSTQTKDVDAVAETINISDEDDDVPAGTTGMTTADRPAAAGKMSAPETVTHGSAGAFQLPAGAFQMATSASQIPTGASQVPEGTTHGLTGKLVAVDITRDTLKDILSRPMALNFDNLITQSKIPKIVAQFHRRSNRADLNTEMYNRNLIFLNKDQFMSQPTGLAPEGAPQPASGLQTEESDDDVQLVLSPEEEIQMPVISSVTSLAVTQPPAVESFTYYFIRQEQCEQLDNAALATSEDHAQFSINYDKFITVDEYLSCGGVENVPILRMDSMQCLWLILGQYVLLTADNIPLSNPNYWTTVNTSAYKFCTQIKFPENTTSECLEVFVCECSLKKCELCKKLEVVELKDGETVENGYDKINASSTNIEATHRPDNLASDQRIQNELKDGDSEKNTNGSAAPKIKVKSFAKLTDDLCDVGNKNPQSFFADGKFYRKMCDRPLMYENERNFCLERKVGICKVFNNSLYKKLCDGKFVKVLTVVKDLAQARALAADGRPLLCASQYPTTPVQTTELPRPLLPPARLRQELRHLLYGSNVETTKATSELARRA